LTGVITAGSIARMKATALAGALIGAALLLPCLPARAESLRCVNGTADEGDSRIAVAYKCGQPLLQDAFCATVYYSQTLNPVPEQFASVLVPCLQVEEWLYDRGPGNLMATVRFRHGRVQAIVYGRLPR
jgi:hypothetical protein